MCAWTEGKPEWRVKWCYRETATWLGYLVNLSICVHFAGTTRNVHKKRCTVTAPYYSLADTLHLQSLGWREKQALYGHIVNCSGAKLAVLKALFHVVSNSGGSLRGSQSRSHSALAFVSTWSILVVDSVLYWFLLPFGLSSGGLGLHHLFKS